MTEIFTFQVDLLRVHIQSIKVNYLHREDPILSRMVSNKIRQSLFILDIYFFKLGYVTTTTSVYIHRPIDKAKV